MLMPNLDFKIPSELISQEPPLNRDSSKLLVVGSDGSFEDKYFYNLIDHLEENDLVIFNDSKVIRARLSVTKGKKTINIHLNREIMPGIWHAFSDSFDDLSKGDEFNLGDNKLVVASKHINGQLYLHFMLHNRTTEEFLEIFGQIPLPQEIREGIADEIDASSYQTIFAYEAGSVSSPSAGLHFSDELMIALKVKGVQVAFVTCHIGVSNFLPINIDNVTTHKAYNEACEIYPETIDAIKLAQQKSKKIVAVGASTARTIERAAESGEIKAGKFENNIFITPGYQFKIIDMLVTNFQISHTSPLILASAFTNPQTMQKIYEHAIAYQYHFLCYGDALLLYKNKS
jgi:S-adenosylmethionine:tRNA ribosyltransferase-isomerase